MFDNARKHYQSILSEIQEAGLWKDERIIESPQSSTIEVGQKKVVNFCANNYLGLASDPRVTAAAKRALDEWGYGLSSVRFICGTTTLHKQLEAEMSEMSDEDRDMFLSELGQSEPGLNRLIRSAYTLLGLQTYFTAGVKEVRAWTIHVGDTGPQAAGVIHTDFEKGYIRAQTIAFDDFIQFKGEQGAKDAGKMRAEGKEYVVKDGDVMNFLFSS